LSSNKFIVLIIITALFVASCGAAEPGGAADLIRTSSRAQKNYRTAEVRLGGVEREMNAQARIDYDTETVIYEGEDIGILKEIFVYNNQQVAKGDALAEIELDNVYLNDELEKLRLNVANAETFLSLEKEARQESIAEMTMGLAGLYGHEAEILKLRIERAKLEYELYIYETEQQIGYWKKDMAEIEEKLRGILITSPVDGIVGRLTSLMVGNEIRPGAAVVYLYYITNFRLSINADTANFRYNMDVEIGIANDQFYEGRVISNPLTANPDGGSLDFKVEVFGINEDPADIMSLYNTISRRRINVAGKTMDLQSVPVLPYNTIYNENGKRYVMLLEDNIVKKRYIQIGLFNFQSAHIVSGLRLGDRVIE